jgi:hypothetical protein
MDSQQALTLIVAQPQILFEVPHGQLQREPGGIELDDDGWGPTAVGTHHEARLPVGGDGHYPHLRGDVAQPHVAPDHVDGLGLALAHDDQLRQGLRGQQSGQLARASFRAWATAWAFADDGGRFIPADGIFPQSTDHGDPRRHQRVQEGGLAEVGIRDDAQGPPLYPLLQLPHQGHDHPPKSRRGTPAGPATQPSGWSCPGNHRARSGQHRSPAPQADPRPMRAQ